MAEGTPSHTRSAESVDTEAVEGFTSTVNHTLTLCRKIALLQEQAAEAMGVIRGLAPRVDDATLEDGYAALKAADAPNRRDLYQEIRRRRRTRPTHQPGEVVRRERGSFDKWPIAPAWVYVLLDSDRNVLYIGKTISPKQRLRTHSYSVPWQHADLIACASEREALALESDLIYHHQPPLNRRDTFSRKAAF